MSRDGGKSWTEAAKGIDITCVTDIRFLKNRTYVSAMDEGVLCSDDDGEHWNQLWPMRYMPALGGHYWRLDVREVDGSDRIISTSSPWEEKFNNQVVISRDGGASFKVRTRTACRRSSRR